MDEPLGFLGGDVLGTPEISLAHKAVFTLVCLLVFSQVSSRQKKRSYEATYGVPFVPYVLPFLGSAPSFGKDPVSFARTWSKELGSGLFGALVGGRVFIFVTDPFAAEHVLSGRFPLLSWTPVKFMVARNSVGMFDDDDARFMSKNRKIHGILEKILIEGVDERIRKYQAAFNGTVVSSLVGEGGSDGGEWESRDMLEIFGGAIWRASLLSLHEYPSLANKEAFDMAVKFNRRFGVFLFKYKMILQKINSPEAYDSREGLLKKIKAAYDSGESNSGEGNLSEYITELVSTYEGNMSRDSVCCLQLLNIMAATTLNTIPTAFWVAYYLLANKSAYAAVEKEVLSLYKAKHATGSQPDDSCFSLSDLEKMVHLDSLITEALRFKTTESMFRTRVALEDCDINVQVDGMKRHVSMKKDAMVLTCPTLLHRDEDVFENANEFVWDRFVPGADGEPPSFAKNGRELRRPVEAFGGGPFMCPGRKFVLMEMKVIVANMLVRYDMRFPRGEVPPPPESPSASFALPGMAQNDIEFELCKRSGFV